MSETLWRDRPWELLRLLRRLIAERAPAEAAALAERDAEAKRIEKGYQRTRRKAQADHDAQQAAAESAHAAARAELVERFQTDYTATQQEYDRRRREIQDRFEADEEAANHRLDESRWEAAAMFDANKGGIDKQVLDLQTTLETFWRQFLVVEQEAVQVLRRRWQWRSYPEPQPDPPPAGRDLIEHFHQGLPVAQAALAALKQQALPQLFSGFWPLLLPLAFFVLSAVPVGRWLGWFTWQWFAVTGLCGVLLAIFAGAILFQLAAAQSAQGWLRLKQILADADLARRAAVEAAAARLKRQATSLAGRREDETAHAIKAHAAEMAALRERRAHDIKEADDRYQPRMAQLAAARDEALRQLDFNYKQRLGEIESRRNGALERIDRQHARKQAACGQRYDEQFAAVADRWRAGLQEFESGLAELRGWSREVFAPLEGDFSAWTPPARIPPALPIGEIELRLADLEKGLPADARLHPAATEFCLPALFSFGHRPVLLLRSGPEGRQAAIETLQTTMLHALTALPPGKVRFTIIDPLGLGENFSAFMHLADYNEQLVNNRIWTESGHIEQRLAEMTAHMEDVIQVYLRNEFKTIEQYNEHAGDLAEPYRILVVANFPTAFTDAAAHRLLSIAASGGRCGVFTLLSVDPKARMPREFQLADLERLAAVLEWSAGRFHWLDAEFGRLPLAVGKPPAADRFTHIVRTVGEMAKDADRVEVPFECVVPPPGEWWTHDSRGGVDVPLGRAGAMKFQHLRLGKGTSQHVLIAGKTGSGKSTLLHALITNVALRYSPDEIELYLVDFKKGVEFKAYAAAGLPHARVIAIESEREFGLSVLERLDGELRRRGDLFRKRGVQDVAGFRAAEPDTLLPRILLIVDEFQELFVEDDRIAQNGALLLDRLVRQGRAFGIHVLLGSQTLAGSYSLPRSTIGQMAVRIALQCSEADSHLILSEENTAARLLQRPGEAIYNDANGLFEGNHPFQVVWLADDERERWLGEAAELAARQGKSYPPPVVFEGNVPADLRQNSQLAALVAAEGWPDLGASPPRAWLGAAVAIKEATAVEFARQGGNNLLVVGHQERSALGVLSAALVSLAAQHRPAEGGEGAALYVLDGARPDSAEAGFFQRLAKALPHRVRLSGVREATAAIEEVAAELARRDEGRLDDAPPLYLFVYDLGRFRELRKGDDDFGFGRFEESKQASPASQFARILRDGPAVGIHVVLWCDTYSNLTRILDRQALRDMELRVLFQMNATDSSNLIDSPAASQLGMHRALFYNEGQGRLEKFRPYGLPDETYLAELRTRLAKG